MADFSLSERAALMEIVQKRETLSALSKFCDWRASEANEQCCRLMREPGNETVAHGYAIRGHVWENLIADLKNQVEKFK